MSFDAHQMDAVLLVGAVVMLVAILAVRASVRVGLPSLLDLLGDGRAARRVRPRHPLRRRRRRARARLRRAGADPGRRWSHDAVGGDPPGRWGSGCRSPPSVSACQRHRDGRRCALPVRLRLGARGAARRRHLADRRRGGVLGAAAGAAAAPPDRRARGGVRPQRRPDRAAGHPGQLRRGPSTTACSASSAIVVFELVAGVGARARGRVRRRLGAAAGGAAVLGPLPVGGPLVHGPGVRRRRGRSTRQRFRRGVRRGTGARQRRAPAPHGDPVVRRGRRLAGPDRAVRHARPAGLAGPDHARTRRAGRWSPGCC